MIHKVMSNIIDDFTKIKVFDSLYKFLRKESEGNDLMNLMDLSDRLLNNYQCIDDPIKVLTESENTFKKELSNMMDMELAVEILNVAENRKKLFNERLFLNYLLIGKMSAGKSTLINRIFIGSDILPVDEKECTKIGIILNHTDYIEESALYYVNLQKYNEYGNSFHYFNYDIERPIAFGLDEVKDVIKKVNKNKSKNNIEYYLIRTPLKIFDYINNEEIRNLRHKIQIIDFPGLDSENLEVAIKSKSDLLEMINGFLFVNRELTLNDDSTEKILYSLLKDIIRRNQFGFSYKSCLFIMITENEKDVENFRKELNKNINIVQRAIPINEKLKNFDSLVKNEDIQIIKFSNYIFKNYLEDYELLLNEINFFKTLNNIENDEKLEDFYNKIKSKIELPKKYKLPENNQNLISKINNNLNINISPKNKEHYSKKIAKYYYYINHNPTEFLNYKMCGFENLKSYLTKIFLYSNIYYKNALKLSLAKYFAIISYKFMEIKSILSKDKSQIDVEYFRKEENQINELQKLDDLFSFNKEKNKKKIHRM